MEPYGGHGGGNADGPSDGDGRVGRGASPALGDGAPGGPSSSVRDPNGNLENKMALNEAKGTRRPDSEQGFDGDLVETARSDGHGGSENETRYSNSDGRALRSGANDEDLSGMASRSGVGDGTAGANARKVNNFSGIISYRNKKTIK